MMYILLKVSENMCFFIKNMKCKEVGVGKEFRD